MLIGSLIMLGSEHVCKALALLSFYWLLCQETVIHSQFCDRYMFDCVILKN